MRDKRPVDELSIEELERILAIRKREARLARLRRYDGRGRRVAVPDVAEAPILAAPEPEPETPQRHEAAADLEPVEPPVTYDITDEAPRFEDEEEPRPPRRPHAVPAGEAARQKRARRRSAFDRVLMAVEIAGVIGILAVLAVGGYLVFIESDKIEALAQQSAAIQQEADAMRATATPAPDLRVSSYVLPGGHYSPDQTNGVPVFNYDELPESVRPAIMAQLSVPQAPLPTPVANSPLPATISIPAINKTASIYQGDDWYSLSKGVGHMAGSGNLEDGRNIVLTAHNDIYGEIFRDIPELQPGDEIILTARNGREYRYVVRDGQQVEPSDTWVLGADVADLTLITCYPYRVDTHRWVVFAERVDGA